MKYIIPIMLFVGALFFSGCQSALEENVVFTRTSHFWPFFGSPSIGEYIEITNVTFSSNEAGQRVVEVGLRNCGPVSWTNWWRHAPEEVTLRAQCDFYKGVRVKSPILWSTNLKTIKIKRGRIYAYKAVCPEKDAMDFQLVLGGYNE